MKWPAYVVIAYGLLLLLGGVIGFAKVHSLASLVMGSASAIIALVGGWLMLKDNHLGHKISIILAGVLFLFFSYRYAKTGAVAPAGLMALISLAVLGILAYFRESDSY